MTSVSPTPQQITATLRTHRDRTINMLITQQQRNQHTQHNAPLPHHTITPHYIHTTTTTTTHPSTHPSPYQREQAERRAVERGERAEERVRHERHRVSVEQQERQHTITRILNTDKQHRQQQLQHQHSRNSRLPAHLRPGWEDDGVSVDEWRRRVREEREAIEAEEEQMMERMKEMKQRIVQLQAEERAEEDRQQRDRDSQQEAERVQREADEKRRDDRRRWAATLTSAPAHYVTEESRAASLSTDSSSDSDSDSAGRHGTASHEDTAAEMTRLWDEFKHKWTPQKQPPSATPPPPTAATSAVEEKGKEKGKEGELQSLTASTDASIRELTAMLNDMIKEFNITAAAAGDEQPIVVQPARHEQTTTAWLDEKSEHDTDRMAAVVSAASISAATAAVTARKPSPLSSPAPSPTWLNTAQRQRSVKRGEAQEAEWQLILQELKHDKRERDEQTPTGRTDGGGRVGLFVPSIFSQREHRVEQELKEQSSHRRQESRTVARPLVEEAEHADDGEDGVVYSGLIDFDVHDPHEIDRQRRIEAQLIADKAARTEQRTQQQQLPDEADKQATDSDVRVREAIDRYKRSEAATEEVGMDDEKSVGRLDEQPRQPRLKPAAVVEPTADVRQWLERLERKIDALANQQQQQSVAEAGKKAQPSSKPQPSAVRPAADIFAPVEQTQQQRDKETDKNANREPHQQQSAQATESITQPADSNQHTTRTHRNTQHRTLDYDGKYAEEDVPPRPPPAAHPTSYYSSAYTVSHHPTVAPSLAAPFVVTAGSATSDSYQRSNAAGTVYGSSGSSGGGLTLQDCFARRMGHVIATNEQRRQARQQRQQAAHAHYAANDQYDTARHHSLSHSHAASKPAGRTGRQYTVSGQAAAGTAVSGTHRRMQLVERGVVGVREARARSARAWRQLPEVRRRRDEQKRREERRRSVERRQSYDRQRRAGQQPS